MRGGRSCRLSGCCGVLPSLPVSLLLLSGRFTLLSRYPLASRVCFASSSCRSRWFSSSHRSSPRSPDTDGGERSGRCLRCGVGRFHVRMMWYHPKFVSAVGRVACSLPRLFSHGCHFASLGCLPNCLSFAYLVRFPYVSAFASAFLLGNRTRPAPRVDGRGDIFSFALPCPSGFIFSAWLWFHVAGGVRHACPFVCSLLFARACSCSIPLSAWAISLFRSGGSGDFFFFRPTPSCRLFLICGS